VAEPPARLPAPGGPRCTLGGDEFAVLLERGEVNNAMVVGERIIASLRQPFMIDGNEVRTGQRGHRRVHPPGQTARRAAAQRRRGDVHRQGAGQEPRGHLRAADARRRRRPPRAHLAARSGRSRTSSWSTTSRSSPRQRQGRRRRGARPLAPARRQPHLSPASSCPSPKRPDSSCRWGGGSSRPPAARRRVA
jgi:hypothetical protein